MIIGGANMIKNTNELILELHEYANPSTKIQRLLKDKKIYKIKQGLYEKWYYLW